MLSKEFFSNGASGKFNIGLKATNGKGVEAVNMIFLMLNKPPENGTCTITPNEGIALVTEFEVSCEGWIDPEDPKKGIKQYVVSGTESSTHVQDKNILNGAQRWSN